MNAGEIAQLGWRMAGEDSRYDGDDLTTTNGLALLAQLNSAYAVVSSTKHPSIGVIPFRGMEQAVTFDSKYVSTSVSSAVDGSEFTLASSDVAVGDVVTVDSETVDVLTASGGTVTVVPDLSSTPSGQAFVRTKQYDLVSDIGITARRVIDIIDLYDLDNEQELFRVNNVTFFDEDGRTPGTPDAYVRFGESTLLMNYPPDASYTYRLRYAQLPAELTAASDELVLPESFHQVVAMRLAFTLLLVREDYEAAWAMKKNYEYDLLHLQNEYEQFWDTEVGRVVLQ